MTLAGSLCDILGGNVKVKIFSAVVVSALIFTATGCMGTPTPWTGPSNGLRVGFYGDSITQLSETGGGTDQGPDRPHMLTEAMVAAGFQSSYSALIGADTADLTNITYPPGSPAPQVVVIALGTNDLHDGYASPESVLSDIATFIDRMKPECAIVVNVAEIPTWGLSTYAPPYNSLLNDLAASRPDVVVADWNSQVQADPTLLELDNVHPDLAGKAAYRSLFVESVRAHLPVNGVCS